MESCSDGTNGTPFDGLSERDRYILAIHKEGYSTRRISTLLKEKYGIKLTSTSVHRHLAIMRQDPDNNVQVNFEPRNLNPEGTRWYKIIARTKTAIDEYFKLYGFKPSSRAMYYQLADEHLLNRGKSDQNNFIRATVDARIGWINSDGSLKYPQLDVDCFADDDSRLANDDYTSDNPTEPTQPGSIPDPNEYIKDMIGRLKYSIIRYDGRGWPGRDGEIGGRWYNQPEYVEVWEEKNGLFLAFKSILADKRINLRANRGYPSLIFLHKCSQKLKEIIDLYHFDPENIHILYFGDWDPSGENIDWYIKMRLRQLGIEGVDFQRIAVTVEQIENKQYKLPLLPIEKQADKKRPNPNMEEFRRRYGDKATHLDAFFTKGRLKYIRQIIRESVDEYWDEDIYDEMVEEYDVAADEPEKMDEEELLESRSMMCKTVTQAFSPGWPKYVSNPEYEGLDDGSEEEDEEEGKDDSNE